MGVARILEDRVTWWNSSMALQVPLRSPMGRCSSVQFERGLVQCQLVRFSAVALREVAHQLASCSLDLMDLLASASAL